MKTLFITGGAGFIGSAFVRLALEKAVYDEIINFDALTYAARLENLPGGSEGGCAGVRNSEIERERENGSAVHRFVKGDIRNADAVLAELPEECDGIINFAAETDVDRSIRSADEFVTTNVFGTQVLLDCARKKGVRRFVQISTDEVMGSLPERDDAFFTEESPFAPNSPYAASKAAAEHMVRAARATHGIDAVVTRCGNNYGPGQFPEKLIPLMIAKALEDKPLPIYGDGFNVRDWIYVTDHCEGVWSVFENGDSGRIYNIGARNTLRNIDVVRAILDILGKPHSLIKPVKDRPGHDRRYAIDPSKIENELGWKPQVGWDEGLKKTVEYYLGFQESGING